MFVSIEKGRIVVTTNGKGGLCPRKKKAVNFFVFVAVQGSVLVTVVIAMI